MQLIFLVSLAAFMLVILFFAWYARLMANRIFGKMNAQLNGILEDNKAPDEWYKRLKKLTDEKKDDHEKEKAFKKYVCFVKGSYKDLVSYAERTTFIQDDVRPDVLSELERFFDEYMDNLKLI